jgi:hypothetical protein
MLARARILMILLAVSAYAAGRTEVAFTGQWIRTMGGMSALVTSSTTMVSDAVIWPLESVTLGDDVLKAGLRPVQGPFELLPHAGPPTWSPS